MSFPFFDYYKQTINKLKNENRKETDSDTHQKLQILPHTYVGRASAFTSCGGSITVEAAYAFPLFFYAAICLIYLLEIMAVQTSVRAGMHYACKEYAKGAYLSPMVSPSKVESDVVGEVGIDRLNRSIVVGGSGGLSAAGSSATISGGVLKCVITYQVKLPIAVFGPLTATRTNQLRIKGWNGYTKQAFGEGKEDTVYVSETGMVYHKDFHCTYLELSIRMVPADEVEHVRNEGQGKYYPCERCAHVAGTGGVYITDTGDRYHNSLGCSGLKRTVYAIPLGEAIGKGACSRCTK